MASSVAMQASPLQFNHCFDHQCWLQKPISAAKCHPEKYHMVSVCLLTDWSDPIFFIDSLLIIDLNCKHHDITGQTRLLAEFICIVAKVMVYTGEHSIAILFWQSPTFGDFTTWLLIGLKGSLIGVE